ncbi:unnamed protein product [Calypogeia fissa]
MGSRSPARCYERRSEKSRRWRITEGKGQEREERKRFFGAGETNAADAGSVAAAEEERFLFADVWCIAVHERSVCGGVIGREANGEKKESLMERSLAGMMMMMMTIRLG